MLLHADCNDLEVMCEMSQYSVDKTTGATLFMVSVSVEARKFSVVLIVRTLAVAEESALVQTRLGLPLSQSGTLSTEGGRGPRSSFFGNNRFCPVVTQASFFFFCSSVLFLTFSQRNSLSAQLNSDAVLHCGFRQQEAQPEQEVAIQWRLQHKGKGWKVLQMETRLDGTEQSAAGGCCVDGWRGGCSA